MAAAAEPDAVADEVVAAAKPDVVADDVAAAAEPDVVDDDRDIGPAAELSAVTAAELVEDKAAARLRTCEPDCDVNGWDKELDDASTRAAELTTTRSSSEFSLQRIQ